MSTRLLVDELEGRDNPSPIGPQLVGPGGPETTTPVQTAPEPAPLTPEQEAELIANQIIDALLNPPPPVVVVVPDTTPTGPSLLDPLFGG